MSCRAEAPGRCGSWLLEVEPRLCGPRRWLFNELSSLIPQHGRDQLPSWPRCVAPWRRHGDHAICPRAVHEGRPFRCRRMHGTLHDFDQAGFIAAPRGYAFGLCDNCAHHAVIIGTVDLSMVRRDDNRLRPGRSRRPISPRSLVNLDRGVPMPKAKSKPASKPAKK